MTIYQQLLRPGRPAQAINELQLLRQARQAYPELAYSQLSTEVLAEITRERGVDFTTALFYDRLRRSPEHGPFIRAVETLQPDLEALPTLQGKLLLAPAAFYREHPELGGDGRLIREIAAEFGLATGLLPLLSTGSVTANAALIRQSLAAEADGAVILVSLSKGSAEVRLALEHEPALAAKIKVWVQICGLVYGSPLADSFLDGPWWQRGLFYGYLAYAGARRQSLSELRYGPDKLLARPARLPTGLPVINVVACPLACHMVGHRRIRYQYLAAFGPNDGSTLLPDAILEPGLVYPIWGADHYFRVPEVSLTLYRLFLYLAQQTATQPQDVGKTWSEPEKNRSFNEVYHQ